MNILITLLAVIVLMLTLLGAFSLNSQRIYPGKRLALYIARDGVDFSSPSVDAEPSQNKYQTAQPSAPVTAADAQDAKQDPALQVAQAEGTSGAGAAVSDAARELAAQIPPRVQPTPGNSARQGLVEEPPPYTVPQQIPWKQDTASSNDLPSDSA